MEADRQGTRMGPAGTYPRMISKILPAPNRTLPLLALLAGCAGDTAGRTNAGGGIVTATGGNPTATSAGGTSGAMTSTGGDADTTATTSASTSTSGGTPGDSGGGLKFDLPNAPDAPPLGEPCTKVDLLFIVDDSGSMEEQQVNLTNSFPGFISEIQTTLDSVESYHVGVITTDAYAWNEPGCQAIGDLVTRTGGMASSNQTCTPFADGFRFMTENDDLATTFACAAKPGIEGSDAERPMDAIREALSPAKNGPGACNEGFLRPDALLVLVLITDEEDDFTFPEFNGSSGDPNQWFSDIVALKDGVETNVVVLSIVGHPPPNACPFGIVEVANRIITWTEKFTYGFIGDVCAPDYAPVFMDALSVVNTACNTFTPPG